MPKLPGTRPRSPHFADRAYTPHWVRRELGPLLPIAVPFHVRAPYRAHRRGSIAGDGIRRQPSVAPTNRCCSASKRGYDGNPGFERCAGGAAETASIEPSKPSSVPRKACAQNARDWTDHSGVRPQPEAKPALPGFHGLSFEELRAFGRQALQIAAPHGAALPVSGRSWQAAEARCLC